MLTLNYLICPSGKKSYKSYFARCTRHMYSVINCIPLTFATLNRKIFSKYGGKHLMVLVYKSHYFSPPYRVQILSPLLHKIHAKLMRSYGIHVDRYAEIGGGYSCFLTHSTEHEIFYFDYY